MLILMSVSPHPHSAASAGPLCNLICQTPLLPCSVVGSESWGYPHLGRLPKAWMPWDGLTICHFIGWLPQYLLTLWISSVLMEVAVIVGMLSKENNRSLGLPTLTRIPLNGSYGDRVGFGLPSNLKMGFKQAFSLFLRHPGRSWEGHLRACGLLSSDWPSGHFSTANETAWGTAKETDAAAGETPSAAWHLSGNCSPRESKLFSCWGGGMAPGCQV